MIELFQMWALVEVLGIICLPLAVTVFHNLPDRGLAFSKALGVVLFAFCVWLPLMVLRFLPFSRVFTVSIVLLLLVVNGGALLRVRVRQTIAKTARRNIVYIVLIEVLFLALVCLLGWLRSLDPRIRSFETFMDEGLLSSIMRSSHFPPHDMWYAGQPINYYYYAHYCVAVLAKLAGVPASIAFNAGISILFGLTGINLFGVSSNIVSWARYLRARKAEDADLLEEDPSTVYPPLLGGVLFGLLTVLFCIILGNLASTQIWWANHNAIGTSFEAAYNFWFGSTRVVEKTINEFPAFSFLLSDFHAHVLALAFTILAIGLIFNLFLEKDGLGLNVYGKGFQMVVTLVVTAIVLGGLFVMNGWDYPTYVGLAVVCIAVQQWLAYRLRFCWPLLLDIVVAAVALIALSFLCYLPFFLDFVSPAQGIGLVDPQNRSAISQEILIYGTFAFLFVSLMIATLMKNPLIMFWQRMRGEAEAEGQNSFLWRTNWKRVGIVGLGVLAVAILIVLLLARNSATLVIAGTFAIAAVCVAFYVLGNRAHVYVLLLGALAFALVAVCEIVFLRDVFADSLPRMNTVFKFYFQAWALLSIACGAGLYFIVQGFKPVRLGGGDLFLLQVVGNGFWYMAFLVLLIAGLLFPVFAPAARFGTGDPLGANPKLAGVSSLDGMAYLKVDPTYQGDYEAIRWLNEHVSDDAVIIEALGNSYTEYGRVSVFTGLATPINWPGHEIQWRVKWQGTAARSADFNQRIADMDEIYRNPDKEAVLNIMKRYQAQYIYVGPLELRKFPTDNLQRFASFMQVVYSANGVTIYKVR
ncbi:YYY domain-containing protein [Thermosporothrix hazakensis]|uniref:YYY domain-containing protein n=1 Tax=Thermosporothrix hazakensis TaxID=644383 RepID=A0A326UBG3_THEHA|nr:DUF2298 domain-containing protein [Thermosporothrix hazakensis]PZW33028.1 YYY domain-containing protein [Thermosporothrix hazakensis]GCE49059.1 hypothetical protein KTH_39280 [Thermosporothrix hazakensis]